MRSGFQCQAGNVSDAVKCSGTFRMGSGRPRKPCMKDADYLVGTARVSYCADCADWFPAEVERERIIGKMTQTEMLKAHFDSGQSLTVLEALQKFGIYALSQRVTNLRQEGYPVESVMVELPNGKRIARYSKLTVAYG